MYKSRLSSFLGFIEFSSSSLRLKLSYMHALQAMERILEVSDTSKQL